MTMGSITSWIRLEPRCRNPDLAQAVQARIHDPLWLLARQWQVAEFQAEDAGTPVLARWRGETSAVTRYFAGAIKPNSAVDALRYDARTMPLETLVERQPLEAPSEAGSLRLAVESGFDFLRRLDAQPTSRRYRADFLARFALPPPTASERAELDPETRSYWTLMATRAPDARRLLAAFRNGDGQRIPLPADLAIEAGDRAEVEAAIDAWLAQHDALLSRPQPGSPAAWNPERLEYAFSIAGAPGNEEMPLTAAQYAAGHLDWHSVDLDLEISLGAVKDNSSGAVVRTLIPAPVSFRGAPAQRFWEIEDAAIDYGLLPAGPGDLAHLMLSEFATDFGNDWYVVPIDLDVGTLTVTRSLVVTDTFGVQTLLRPINDTSSARTGWSMFELSPILRSAATARPRSNLLFLAPSLLQGLDGRPLEEVLFLRDEMANMAWAVEHALQGPLEQRIEPGVEPEPNAGPAAQPSAMLRYRLATDVPSNWIPLLPQRIETDPPSLRLRPAAVLAPDGTNALHRARSALLDRAPQLAIFDEEIPREGAKVTRQFEFTRWIAGASLLWVGLRKRVGKGEGSSALRFDSAD
jgi:hypothetical protein